jgi:hypothetical protein
LLNSLAELYLSLKKDVRVHKLSIKERIMLVFLKLKLDLTFVALGVLFGNISAPTCKAIFQTTVLVLTEILRNVIVFPSRDEILKNTYSEFFLRLAIGFYMPIFQPPVNFCSDKNIQTIFETKLEDFLNYRIDYNLRS